jgi:hypothetical protein
MTMTEPTTPVAEQPGAELVEMAWDPITRIVGSLGIYAKVDFKNRRVAECYSTSSVFRGYSIFMKGKDPRDAHFITSRICGICGDNHAACSVYNQNMAYGVRPPHLGEWIMNRAQIPVKEYEQLATRFNPVKFDADAWVKLAQDAGMKYIVITSKHHDGFALFDAHEASFVDASDAMEFRLHRRLAYNLRTIHEGRYLWATNRQAESGAVRERCMADNTLWVQELVGAPVKSVVWGHNAHVGFDVFVGGGVMMGGHIREAIGNAYRAIGFSFTRGTLTAIGDEDDAAVA